MLLLLDGLPCCYHWKVYRTVLTRWCAMLLLLDGLSRCRQLSREMYVILWADFGVGGRGQKAVGRVLV